MKDRGTKLPVLLRFSNILDDRIQHINESFAQAIKEVGPNGHFFGCEHTQERYTTAFYEPFLSDWRNYEAWAEDGGKWTSDRANKVWKDILNDFEAPPMDEAIREELQSFVARRKSEGGVPTDF